MLETNVPCMTHIPFGLAVVKLLSSIMVKTGPLHFRVRPDLLVLLDAQLTYWHLSAMLL